MKKQVWKVRDELTQPKASSPFTAIESLVPIYRPTNQSVIQVPKNFAEKPQIDASIIGVNPALKMQA
jgi:hypothetical protein